MAHTQKCKVAHQQDQAAKAWSIILQHPAVCSHQSNVCTLLQVSNATRTVLLRSENHLVNLQLTELSRVGSWAGHPFHSAALLSNFAAWIPKHAGLVRSIQVSRAIFDLWHADAHAAYSSDSGEDDDDDDGVAAATRRAHHVLHALQEQLQLDSSVANPILQHSLLLAALQPAATSLAANSGCTTAIAAAPTVFQLQSFSSDFSPSASVLSALPAASLTKLDFTPSAPLPDAQNAAAALSILTNLQVLNLQLGGLVQQDFAAISQLTKLTTLTMDLVWSDLNKLELLPGQLQQVHLILTDPVVDMFMMIGVAVASADDSDPGVPVNLSHLTALQHLRLLNQTNNEFQSGSTLAATIQDLIVEHYRNLGPHGAVAPLSASGLQHLQRLELCNCTDGPQDLLSLKDSPQLQHLFLNYQGNFLPDNLCIAAVWQQLPLKHLSVSEMQMTAEQAVSLLKGIGAATTLTSLEYKVTVPYCMEDGPGAEHPLKYAYGDWVVWLVSPDVTRIPTCQSLKGLTQLQSLKLGFDGNGYLQPCWWAERQQQAPLARDAVEDPSNMQSSTSLLHYEDFLQDAIHLTALQQLTHLDLKDVDIPGMGIPFVDDSVVVSISSALHELRELYLAPGHVKMRLELAECISALARMTGLQTLSIEGAKEQDPEHNEELESKRREHGQCFTQSLSDCLWKLTQLTRLTALGGFESCEQTELERFWDALLA